MSNAILVGYDPREADHAPVDFGVMAARLTGGRLVVAVVEVGRVVDHGGVDGDLVGDSAAALDLIQAKLRSAGVPFECRRVEATSAARGLQEAAEREHAALLV